MSTNYDLQQSLEEINNGMEYIKRICKENDKNLYERWKAGGFIVDTNIVSMYPNVDEVVGSLIDDLEEDEEEEGEFFSFQNHRAASLWRDAYRPGYEIVCQDGSYLVCEPLT